MIGLDPIRNGYDSFQLRITYGYASKYANGDSSKILIIKNRMGKWSAEIQKIIPFISNDSSFYTVISQKRNISPRSGWQPFMKKFLNYEVFQMPFQEIEEEKGVVTTATVVLFQIATYDTYRDYRYYIPEFYEEKHFEVEELKKIIPFLQNEFGLMLSYSSRK